MRRFHGGDPGGAVGALHRGHRQRVDGFAARRFFPRAGPSSPARRRRVPRRDPPRPSRYFSLPPLAGVASVLLFVVAANPVARGNLLSFVRNVAFTLCSVIYVTLHNVVSKPNAYIHPKTRYFQFNAILIQHKSTLRRKQRYVSKSTQPNTTKSIKTQHDKTQLNPTQHNITRQNPNQQIWVLSHTQDNTTKPNPTQHNKPQPNPSKNPIFKTTKTISKPIQPNMTRFFI